MRALILAATLACLAFASVAAAQASWPALTVSECNSAAVLDQQSSESCMGSLLAHAHTCCQMSDPMGARPAMVFPGGLYKSSTSANIPSATVSGALITLKPGGMRELHWHQPNEWALVLNGTCRCVQQCLLAICTMRCALVYAWPWWPTQPVVLQHAKMY